MLSRAGRVLTTGAGGERLGGNATGLEPGESVALNRDGGPPVTVTAVRGSVDVVGEIVAGEGPFDVVVLFIGGATVPEAWGDAKLTLTADSAVEAAGLLGSAPIAPIHQDGWAHFTSGAGDVERAFARAGLADRLRPVAPGQRIELS